MSGIATTVVWSCFFFDHEFAVRPEPTATDSAEYLTWRKLAAKNEHDFAVESVNNKATVVPLTHAHFRTGSAVLLPEGETPVSGAAAGSGASASSVCALAMALRFDEERPGHTMLIAGHTDSVGGEAGNQELSEQRAELVLPLPTCNGSQKRPEQRWGGSALEPQGEVEQVPAGTFQPGPPFGDLWCLSREAVYNEELVRNMVRRTPR